MMEEKKVPLLSQKEYLKKYLSKDKSKKKKKPKISSSCHVKRSVIIDDDLGLGDVANIDDVEFNLDYLGDEAPQVVGIVDERPAELKAKEKYSSNLWQAIGDKKTESSDEVAELKKIKNVTKSDYDSDQSPPRVDKTDLGRTLNDKKNKNDTLEKSRSDRISVDSDLSPQRKRNKKEDNSDSDMSPPRVSKNKKNTLHRENERSKHKETFDKERRYADNHSKSRTKHEDSDSEYKSKYRRDRDRSYGDKGKYSRRDKNENGVSRSSSNREKYNRGDGDALNRHRSRKYEDHEESYRKTESSRKYEKRKKEEIDSDLSPERSSRKRKDKLHSSDDAKEKMQDGKKAGLQDAKQLKEELRKVKENEDKLFKKMDPTLLGATAAPIKRDRKTGQIRQTEKEVEEDKAKAEKRAKTENKYHKWGRGLKQIQEQEDRIADVIHEMSKPLARYRDDKDLDAFLRAQEREGDPMLEYIKNKQAESYSVIDLTVGSTKRKYSGSFMPNRFGIAPGYRWDGVDRSNGYEKKWFEQKNTRKAIAEEAYKWSTSDM